MAGARPPRGRRSVALAALGLVLTTLVLASDASQPAGAADAARPRRVLVLSLPGVGWRDVDATLPHLTRLLDESAMANLSVRAPRLKVDRAGSYVTVSAGDKAVGRGAVDDGSGLPPDGAAFEAAKVVGADRAADLYQRRTGRGASDGLVHLGVVALTAANEETTHQADVGALGEALDAAGWSRAVIANADGTDAPDRAMPVHREAVAALIDRDGTVPGGAVGPELLTRDPAAPFGIRLDAPAVSRAFSSAWRDRAVVLVEASDLVRADAYRSIADDAHATALWRAMLVRTDALVGRLLEQVDPDRDAVVVIGTTPGDDSLLPLAAIRSPGVAPGLLRSGTTQRSGFVQLMDVAPTVLRLAGAEPTSAMRGRPMEVGDRSGTPSERRAHLVEIDDAAAFRRDTVQRVALVCIAGGIALAAAAVAWLMGWASGVTARWLLRLGAAALLAYVPVVFVARLLPFHDAGQGAYWAFLVGGSFLVGAAAVALTRRSPVTGAIVGVGAIVAVLALDVVIGAPMQLNGGLGYSPEVAGRFIGFGNAGYAALSAAALLLAGLVAHAVGGRTGAWWGVAILAGALVVDGAPFWGADVGGVLSMVPAYGLTALMLLQVRVRVRTAVVLGGITLAAIGAATLVDLSRPAAQRTHLGRLVEQVQGQGSDAFTSVIERKLGLNLAASVTSEWRFLVLAVAVLVVVLAVGRDGPRARLGRAVPELRATLSGFAVLVVLGYALNDSGLLVPGLMLVVLEGVLVTLVAQPDYAGSSRSQIRAALPPVMRARSAAGM